MNAFDETSAGHSVGRRVVVVSDFGREGVAIIVTADSDVIEIVRVNEYF